MIIFKTVFKILNKLKGMLILYTAILIAITLMNTTSGNIGSYEATKPDITIVNNDNNDFITNHFVNYLKENTNIKEFKDQEKEMMPFFIEILVPSLPFLKTLESLF